MASGEFYHRHLLVDRWERNYVYSDGRRKRKAFWAGLLPRNETDLEIIGSSSSVRQRANEQLQPTPRRNAGAQKARLGNCAPAARLQTLARCG